MLFLSCGLLSLLSPSFPREEFRFIGSIIPPLTVIFFWSWRFTAIELSFSLLNFLWDEKISLVLGMFDNLNLNSLGTAYTWFFLTISVAIVDFVFLDLESIIGVEISNSLILFSSEVNSLIWWTTLLLSSLPTSLSWILLSKEWFSSILTLFSSPDFPVFEVGYDLLKAGDLGLIF